MMESGWTTWMDAPDSRRHFKLTLTDLDMLSMDRERLEMLQDGLWLIEQSFKGNVRGPLSTPRLGLPVR